MGRALRKIQARKEALNSLQRLVENPENVLVVHYSCESFYGRTDGKSPRICSIAVRSLASGQTSSFSIHQIAEREGVALEDIDQNYHRLERILLDEFYKLVASREGSRWLHWNMTSIEYGFPALAHRYRVLGGLPKVIPEAQLIDLSAALKDIYGRKYIENPKLNNLTIRNRLKTRDFMTGAEEAYAFEAKKFIEVHQSTQAKAYILSELLRHTVDETLETNARMLDVKKLGAQAVLERIRESSVTKFLALLAMVSGLIVAILTLAGVF